MNKIAVASAFIGACVIVPGVLMMSGNLICGIVLIAIGCFAFLVSLISFIQANTKIRKNIKSQVVRGLVRKGFLTYEQATGLSENAISDLEEKWIQGKGNIKSRVVRGLVRKGFLTYEQATGLSENAISNLEERSSQGIENISNRRIRKLIEDKYLTLEDAIGLPFHHKSTLSDFYINQLIRLGVLTLERAYELEWPGKGNLTIEPIYTLIVWDILTIDRAIRLSDNHVEALLDDETRQRLFAGDLRIDDIIGVDYPHTPMINDSQSTHSDSVHQTVSKSAAELMRLYGSGIEGEGLEQVLENVRSQVSGEYKSDTRFIGGLTVDKYEAAKRCVSMLTAGDYAFYDRASNVKTRELLALTFLAISDNDKRIGSFEDAKTQYLLGLYEIQRGYNLDERGQDDSCDDKPICAGGTFNKLIEKLQSIHPSCEICFITEATAALKLPVVVKEAAMRFLSGLANPQSKAELLEFTTQIAAIKKDGLTVIYNQIKPEIANLMFGEFGSLYENQYSEEFTGLVNEGVYTELNKLSQFQEQIQNSEGYRKYCSSMLHCPMFFSSSRAIHSSDGAIESQLQL